MTSYEIERRRIRTMSDETLATAITDGTAACDATWAAWVVVRDAGQTDLWCAEFQAHNATMRVLQPLKAEEYRRETDRDMARKLGRWARPPMHGIPGPDEDENEITDIPRAWERR